MAKSWRSADVVSGPTAMVGSRRRGSVLILVMTLLGVLFVIGVAFLAAVNFEADMIAAERQRDQNEGGVGAVLEDLDSILRDGLMAAPGVPFGGDLLGSSVTAFAELPGVHNIFAPIEPYESGGRLIFGSLTDVWALKNDSHDGSAFRSLRAYGIDGIDVGWPSGVKIVLDPDPDPPPTIYPVDSDGDGITDTLQFPISELGFPKAQVAALTTQLSPASNPSGEVYLGLRVIAHGGLVNLNESHPRLIANVLDVDIADLSNNGPHPELGYFRHRPTLEQVPYSPWLEEGTLRRRALLPPRAISPSLLHGNPFELSDFGGADLATKIFPPISDVVFETVYEGMHRYTPFTLEQNSNGTWREPYSPGDPDSPPLWAVRMEPFISAEWDSTGNAYDRRHLVTTISHDDLLSRGGRVSVTTGGITGDADLRDRMIAVNRGAWDPDECPQPLPFEYADYPHTIPNETKPGASQCQCPTEESCEFNPRKGRLLLSLPWLDEVADAGFDEKLRNRLIHDVFMMLVSNAAGPYWDEIDCTSVACPGVEVPDMSSTPPLCRDPVTGQTHRLSVLSRTAASLTANMLDYMDFDDVDGDLLDDNIPTRVALRSFDFADAASVGREFGGAALSDVTPQYVYGLERQPYITEVAIAVDKTGNPAAWAVELYNPYDQNLKTNVDAAGNRPYWLVELDPSASNPLATAHWIPLTDPMRAGEFTVFKTDPGNLFGVTGLTANGRVHLMAGTSTLGFGNGLNIYLVRRLTYPDDTLPTNIVLDQFAVDGPNIGILPGDETAPAIFSMQRAVTPDGRWKAPVPATPGVDLSGHTLGNFNGDNPMVRPVEVKFANTGSFTRLHPDDDPYNPVGGVAFPTTGSLLLLMRHANRSWVDYETPAKGGVTFVVIEDLAFTTWLDDVTTWSEPGTAQPITVREDALVDNGRMPVFDPGVDITYVGRRYAHHVHPATGACCLPDGSCIDGLTSQPQCEAIVGSTFLVGAECSSDACQTGRDAPGSLRNLPWGQLVFDYFTALPLSSPGPYGNPANDPDFETGRADSIPRVDLDGLRVHGRINLNAAPWKVLAGLPLSPMERIPQSFRGKIRFAAGLVVDPNSMVDPLAAIIPANEEQYLWVTDDEVPAIAEPLAQAIVAYRDAREIAGTDANGNPFTTGDYGDNPAGRGWMADPPDARRGTGFLSVGELASVRHPNAPWTDSGYSLYRIDSGELNPSQPKRDPSQSKPDYVNAVALLVSLGDWVTVRSQVFTVYGTLRGEPDEDILDPNPTVDDGRRAAADVDTRAIRFQETVDRLPTFLGEPEPVSVGERTTAKYIDVQND